MAPGEKTMSSRLLTMKFMQRAAATPSSPSTPEGPPSKRQRLSTGGSGNGSGNGSGSGPSTPRTPDGDYSSAVQAALAAEERKRTQALEKAAAEAGETRWVLSFRDEGEAGKDLLRVRCAGFADIDAGVRGEGEEGEGEEGEEEDALQPVVAGRRTFGKAAKKPEAKNEGSGSDSSSTSSSSEDEEEGDETQDPTEALIRRARRREEAKSKLASEKKKKKAKAEAALLAERRRKKEINLNSRRPTSISNNGGGGGLSGRAGGAGGSPSAANVQCHNCSVVGHFARDCPRRGKRRSSGY